MPHAFKLVLLTLVGAALVAPSAAFANDEQQPPSSEPLTLSFEVVSAVPETRTAKVVLECAGGYSGKGLAVQVAEGVDMAAFAVGAHLAGKVDKSTNPPTVLALQTSTCGEEQPKPKPQCPPTEPAPTRAAAATYDRCPKPVEPKPQCPEPDPGTTRTANYNRCENDDERDGDRRRTPKFRPSFLNRVWRFEGSADFYETGVLGMTVEKVRGLPRRLRDQDDELLDQDALVLVGTRTKIYGTDGKRTTTDVLADADRVSVNGKLLPPSKWRDDEDGQSTPTLRAKRVYVLG